MPKRIQRKLTKGWKMPEGAVYVGRPTKWGNQWNTKVVDPSSGGVINRPRHEVVRIFKKWLEANQGGAERFRIPLHELRGKDLACWCPLDQTCHADVLLEIANAAPPKEANASQRWILIGTGEGADSAVVTDLRQGLHDFMCVCKQPLDVCKDETVLWVLRDMEESGNSWARDEGGNRFQYSADFECSQLTITSLIERPRSLVNLFSPEDAPAQAAMIEKLREALVLIEHKAEQRLQGQYTEKQIVELILATSRAALSPSDPAPPKESHE